MDTNEGCPSGLLTMEVQVDSSSGSIEPSKIELKISAGPWSIARHIDIVDRSRVVIQFENDDANNATHAHVNSTATSRLLGFNEAPSPRRCQLHRVRLADGSHMLVRGRETRRETQSMYWENNRADDACTMLTMLEQHNRELDHLLS